MADKQGSTSGLVWKTLIPVAIGVAVVVGMMMREFTLDQFRTIPWTPVSIVGILLAVVAMTGREFGLMWRWRVLTDSGLTWRQSFRVTMMQEFTSAITPTTAGGSALSMVFLHREGLSLGRSTSITLVTLMLDELFVVVACPLIFLLIPGGEIFGFAEDKLAAGLRVSFWIVYGGVCLITVLLYIGAFVAPHRIAAGLTRLFGLRWLRRWQPKVREMGQNLTEAGRDLRHRPWRWWAQAFSATVMTWVSRYLVVNALFFGFAPTAPQTIVFARQFIVWTLLTVSPTPGGSGISEWLFATYYGDLLPVASMALVIAVIWRLISYYVYLIFGVFALPSWLRRPKSRS